MYVSVNGLFAEDPNKQRYIKEGHQTLVADSALDETPGGVAGHEIRPPGKALSEGSHRRVFRDDLLIIFLST